jgi:post-segregation antitoxin (ccd killing protein)
MSWLGRLMGKSPPASAPEPPPTAVVVPEDIADRLTATGIPLSDAVEAALREHLTTLEQAHQRGEAAKPFWLAREDEQGGDIEDRLRDRIAQRRSGEAEAER